MKNILFFALLLFFVSGCATVHTGEYAVPVNDHKRTEKKVKKTFKKTFSKDGFQEDVTVPAKKNDAIDKSESLVMKKSVKEIVNLEEEEFEVVNNSRAFEASEDFPILAVTSSVARRRGKGLVVSGEEVLRLSSPHFAVVTFTFENRSNRWISMENLEISFGDRLADRQVKFPVGEDLVFWHEGTLNRNAIREHNTQLALAMVGAVGASIAYNSGTNTSNMQMGTAMAIASGTALTANDMAKRLGRIHNPAFVPRDHLLSGDVTIPPKLFIRRWILFYTENPKELPYLKDIYLSYNEKGKEKKRLKLSFRKQYSASEWQSSKRGRPTLIPSGGN